jgi:hypothetical protein
VSLYGRAAQPVVDRFAEAFVRDRHHRDLYGASGVELAEMTEFAVASTRSPRSERFNIATALSTPATADEPNVSGASPGLERGRDVSGSGSAPSNVVLLSPFSKQPRW